MKNPHVPVWRLSEIEKRYLVLTRAKLSYIYPQKKVYRWFKSMYRYLVSNEDYRRAAVVKKAEDVFLKEQVSKITVE